MSRPDQDSAITATRRSFVVAAGAALFAACTSAAGPTRSSGVTAGEPSTVPVSLPELVTGDFGKPATCQLLSETTAGPFGLDQQFERSDISEGVSGWPVRLGLRLLDRGCRPLSGRQVEIWHTDATGDYSAFSDNGNGKDEAEGSTFLRGTQSVNEAGIVEFQTIYPGWYPGRAPHIHVRVRERQSAIFTTQLYFPDSYTASIYSTSEYVDNGSADTSNQRDSLAGDVTSNGTLLNVADAETARGEGTIALLNLALPT